MRILVALNLLCVALVLFISSIVTGCSSGESTDANANESEVSEGSSCDMYKSWWPLVGIVYRGHADDAGDFLERLNISFQYFDISVVKSSRPWGYLAAIIPSGGLDGLSSDEDVKAGIDAYVKNGSTLIVFAQAYGDDYSILPGGNVSGCGYTECISQTSGSVEVNTYHEILLGQSSNILDVSIDGYMDSYPENAEVILNTVNESMPAMIVYEYGNGTVIATTAYTDYAYGDNESASQDEIIMVRDMVAWAVYHSLDIDEVNVGDSIEYSVQVTNDDSPIYEDNHPQFDLGETVIIPNEVKNHSDLTADRIIFSILKPGAEEEHIEADVFIPPDGTSTVNFVYETSESSMVGQYYAGYSLYSGEELLRLGVVGDFFVGLELSELSNYTVTFILCDSNCNTVKQEIETISVPYGRTETVSFNSPSISAPGICRLDYEVVDYKGSAVDWDFKIYAVSNYSSIDK